MNKKTLISEFFTTININIFLSTLGLLTYKLPFLRYGNYCKILESELICYIGNLNSKIISFYNGRSAIYHTLNMIGISNNDEVIVSGYTCISVSNAVIQSGAKIIYSDIDKEDLGFDIKELEKNITKKTRVIIVQHTFGKPSKIKKILEIAKNNNILIIEDCAHSLGSRINGKKIGLFGDFSIFSTGRDKVISGVTGGFLLINNSDYFNKIEQIETNLVMPSRLLTIRNLLYNIIAYKAYKLYDFLNLGKVIIHLGRKLNLITEILTKKEKICEYKDFNYKLPNSLAYLASKELQKIKIYSAHRASIAEYYDELIIHEDIKPLFKISEKEKNNYFRYPIIIINEEKKEKLYSYMKKNKVLLGNTWSGVNIVPSGVILSDASYNLGTCKIAENISKRILTLPNHRLINFNDAKRVVRLLNNFEK